MSDKKEPEKIRKVSQGNVRNPHTGQGISTNSQQPDTKLQAKPKKPKA